MEPYGKLARVIASADRAIDLYFDGLFRSQGKYGFHHALGTIALHRMKFDQTRPDEGAAAFTEYAPDGIPV
jgi:hypothetical protein